MIKDIKWNNSGTISKDGVLTDKIHINDLDLTIDISGNVTHSGYAAIDWDTTANIQTEFTFTDSDITKSIDSTTWTLTDVNFVNSDLATDVDATFTFNPSVKFVYAPNGVKNLAGDILYHKDGTWELHRDGGPAVTRVDGTKEWWLNGKRHREDGPAIIDADGDRDWWYHGVNYKHKEFRKIIRINLELKRLFNETMEHVFSPDFPISVSSEIDLTDIAKIQFKIIDIPAPAKDKSKDDMIAQALATEEGKEALREVMLGALKSKKADDDEVIEALPVSEDEDMGWGLALGALALAAVLKSHKEKKKKEKEKTKEIEQKEAQCS